MSENNWLLYTWIKKKLNNTVISLSPGKYHTEISDELVATSADQESGLSK